MDERMTCRAVKLGDNINTDMIVPGKYLSTLDPEVLAQHVLEGVDEELPSKIREGDVIVAGENFGCGSSREHAPIALKAAGISVVVAESCARIFFRNAINVGLPVIICPGISSVDDELELELDFSAGRVIAGSKRFAFEPFSAEVSEILEAGGLVQLMRRTMEERGDG